MLVTFISIIIINIILFKNLTFFEKIFNISDYPDKRKIHSSPVPLLGGTFFIINVIYIFFISIYTNFNLIELKFNTSEIMSVCFGTSLFYFLGLLDDKNTKMSANLRLIFSIIILSFVMFLDSNLILNSLKISFAVDDKNNIILLPSYINWILTIFSFLVLINAFNMTDGINLLFTGYLLFIFLILFVLDIFNLFFIIILPFFILFFIENNKSKIFFGSSGVMPASFLVGYIFIKSYNNGVLIYSDWVFVILLIPLLELLRLILLRLKRKQHIFQADQNHLHHYIYLNFKNHEAILILLTIYFLPSLIIIFKISTYAVSLFVLIYFYLIQKYKNKIT